MKETIYTDQTDKFPVKSSRGCRYVMVMMEIDTNYIDAKPMKNKTEEDIILSYQLLLKQIIDTGVFNL